MNKYFDSFNSRNLLHNTADSFLANTFGQQRPCSCAVCTTQ